MSVLLLGLPLISHVVRSTTAFDSNFEIDHEDLRIVPGGKFITGFLVVPDAADLPRKERALHASTFAPMIPNILLSADPTYRIDPESRLSKLYFTRPTVLTQKSPQRWLLRLGRRPITSNVSGGVPFSIVEEAKPIE